MPSTQKQGFNFRRKIPMKKLWILFLLLCMPISAFSEETLKPEERGNIHVGQLQIHPYLSLTEAYDDNVYANSTNTKGDWITTTSPGVQLLMPFGNNKLAAEYKAVIDNYADYTSEDTADHYASVLGDFKFASVYGLKVSDNYVYGHIPRSSSGSGEIEKYNKNAAAVSASYIFADRFKFETGYTRTDWQYTQDFDKYQSRNENLIPTYLYYRFLPKTSAFVEYDFKNVIYDLKAYGLDNQVQTPFIGLTWDIREDTKGIAKVGYLHKSFEASNKSGVDTWTASVNLKHAFTEISSIRVTALRDVNEANVTGTSYFVTTGAYAEYTHKLSYKISALARGSYGADDYSNGIAPYSNREDRTWLGGVGLKYQMRPWLDFVLNYNHRDRDSNIAYWDMVDNRTSLTVDFAL